MYMTSCSTDEKDILEKKGGNLEDTVKWVDKQNYYWSMPRFSQNDDYEVTQKETILKDTKKLRSAFQTRSLYVVHRVW